MILYDELANGNSIHEENNKLFKLSNGKYLFVGVYIYGNDGKIDDEDESVYDEEMLFDGNPIDWYYTLFDETGRFESSGRLFDPDNYSDMDAEEAAESFIDDIYGSSSGITFEIATDATCPILEPFSVTIK